MSWNSKGNFLPLSNTNASSLSMVAWTGDGAIMPATPGLSSGYIYFCRAYVDLSAASTHIYLAQIASAGTGLSNSYMGVYQPGAGGALLAKTADLSTSLMTATISAPWQFTFASSPSTTISAMTLNTEIWLAILLGAQGGTVPTFVGRNSTGTNLGMTSDYRMWMTNSAGNTSLPSTVPATISASTSGQSIPFIAIGP
jgi:hypothetical protein